jgi:hypothetical protein
MHFACRPPFRLSIIVADAILQIPVECDGSLTGAVKV